ILAPADDSGLEKDAEVLRHVLLRGAGSRRQLLDARLTPTQLVDQLDPHRLRQDAEAVRDQRNEVVRKRVRKRHRSRSSPSRAGATSAEALNIAAANSATASLA